MDPLGMFEAWDKLKARGSGWYWLAGTLRNGDIYHVCSLASAFAAVHGRADPIYLVVFHEFQAKVASLFRDQFKEIVIAPPGLPNSLEGWQVFFEKTGLPRFGRDVPLPLHPFFYDYGEFAIEFTANTTLTWMDIYKKTLYLPGDVEPSFPAIDEQRCEAAAKLCQAAGMPQSRSVILFPYAQSLPAMALSHFAQLARDLIEDGYAVFTSVAHGETAVEGTQPIFVPFDLLIDVAEYAGWVVAIRSGICDITSSARCRKTYIYPDFPALVHWSVRAMELARDAAEIVFSFGTASADEFSAIVRSLETAAPVSAAPRRLSSLLGMTREGAHIRFSSFPAADMQPSVGVASADNAPRMLVITDMPKHDHPRLANELSGLVNKLETEATDGTRFYACRDSTPFDHFEEVELADLRSGRYSASRYWHSLIVLSNCGEGGLADVLPLSARTLVFRLPVLEKFNTPIHLGEAFGSLGHKEAAARFRPLVVEGVHFLEGWSGLEPWGLWTNALRGSIKMLLTHGLGAQATIELNVQGCVSPVFPQIRLEVCVNGVSAGRYEVGHNSTLLVPIGHCCPGSRSVLIEFLLDEARSPMEQVGHPDNRKLGVGLKSLIVWSEPRQACSTIV